MWAGVSKWAMLRIHAKISIYRMLSFVLHGIQVEIPTGEKVFDWEIPYEWSIKKAFIKDSEDNIIVDFKDNVLQKIIDNSLILYGFNKHEKNEPEPPNPNYS